VPALLPQPYWLVIESLFAAKAAEIDERAMAATKNTPLIFMIFLLFPAGLTVGEH
jgi:hypothetical protein